MPKIFGGLFFENLVRQDDYFECQCRLYQLGLINGIQLRVAHPSLTPGVTADKLPAVLARLPSGMEVFVHIGAENDGVDFGESEDRKGVFAKSGYSSWAKWNMETVAWAKTVAGAAPLCCRQPMAVAHPGIGSRPGDEAARQRVERVLDSVIQDGDVALENVTTFNPQDGHWGFGGTPDDMRRLLGDPSLGRQALLDFTHLAVTVNEARATGRKELRQCLIFEQALVDFLALPHCSICHYSGFPPAEHLADNHDYLHATPPPMLMEALRTMAVVCLEVYFVDGVEEKIARFRDSYSI